MAGIDGLSAAIEVSADTRDAQRDLGGLERTMGKLRGEAGTGARAQDKLSEALRRQEQAAKRAERGLGGVTTALRRMLPALSVAAVVGFTRSIADAGDKMLVLRQQADRLARSEAGFRILYESAQRLGVEITDLTGQANQFVPALSKVGRGFGESVRFIEDLTKSMRLYGVEGQAATSVTTQLGQALSGGRLNGEELVILQQNAGGLAQLFEQAIHEITGSQESLKELGAQGKLSSEVVIEAWDRVFAQLRPELESLPDLLSQQVSRFRNAASRLWGSLDEQLKLSESWSFLTGGAADLFDALADQMTGFADRRLISSDVFGQFSPQITETIKKIDDLEKALQDLDKIKVTWFDGQLFVASQANIERFTTELGAAREQLNIYKEMAAEDREVVNAWNAQTKAVQDHGKQLQDVVKIGDQYFRPRDNVLAGWEKVDDKLRREIARMQRDLSQDTGIVLPISSTWRNQPGSHHSTGNAVDLSLRDVTEAELRAAEQWWQANSYKYPLVMPVKFERPGDPLTGGSGPHWHVQLEQGAKKAAAGVRGLTDAEREAEKASKALADQQLRANDALRNGSAQAEEYLQGLRDQIALQSLSTEEQAAQRAELELTRRARAAEQDAIDAAARGNTVLADALMQVAQGYRAAVPEARELAAELERGKDVASDMEQVITGALEEIGRSIQRELSDTIYDVLDGSLDEAKNWGEAFKDIVRRTIADIAAYALREKIIVPMVVNPIANGLGLGNLAGGAQGANAALNLGSSIGGLSSAVTGLSTGISNLFTGGQAAYSASFGASSLMGGSMGASMAAGQAASSAATGLAGLASVASAAVPVIAAFAAIASMAGLFGGKDKLHPGATLGVDDGRIRVGRGQDMTAEQSAEFKSAIKQSNAAMREFAKSLGDSAVEALEDWDANLRPIKADNIGETLEKWLQRGLEKAVKGFAAGVEGGTGYKQLVDELARNTDPQQFLQAFVALNQQLGQVQSVLQSIHPDSASTLESAVHYFNEIGKAGSDINATLGALSQMGAYLDELRTPAEQLEHVTGLLENKFRDLGIAIPESEEELKKTLNSLQLWKQDQIELGIAYGEAAPLLREYFSLQKALAAAQESVTESTADATAAERDLAAARRSAADIAEERARLEIELLRAQGREEEAVARERERSLAALDQSNRALQEQIWAEQDAAAERERAREREREAIERERELVQDSYDRSTEAARRNADAQRDAINRSAQAQQEAYQRQIEAAREFVSELNSVIGTLDSAMRSLGYVNDEVASLDRARAVRQLSALSASGRTPRAEEADRIAAALTASEGTYRTQEEETAAEALIRADLRNVKSRAERELEAAEAQVERLERQIELISEWRDRQLEQAQAALERQLEQADAWREAELAKLDAIALNTSAGTADGPPLQAVETPAQREQVEETRALRVDLTRVSDAQQYTQDLVLELLRKWDNDGLPHPRDEGEPAAFVFGYEG